MVESTSSDLCGTCSLRESTMDLIFKCQTYGSIRNCFNFFSTFPDLKTIFLKKGWMELTFFIKQTGIALVNNHRINAQKKSAPKQIWLHSIQKWPVYRQLYLFYVYFSHRVRIIFWFFITWQHRTMFDCIWSHLLFSLVYLIWSVTCYC